MSKDQTPWHLNGLHHLTDKKEQLIMILSPWRENSFDDNPEAIDNMELIKHRVNSYDDLLEACKTAKDILVRLAEEGKSPFGYLFLEQAINKAERKVWHV